MFVVWYVLSVQSAQTKILLYGGYIMKNVTVYHSVTHRTSYYGITVHESREGNTVRYWIMSSTGVDYYCGGTYPTMKQIDDFKDDVCKHLFTQS